MNLIIVVFGFFIVILILINLLFSYLIISKSVRKIIVPELIKNGCDFIRIEKVGFLKTGDFKDLSIAIRPYNPMGNYKISLYRYVFYKDKSKNERKTTVKIEWNILRKTKIEFKPIL